MVWFVKTLSNKVETINKGSVIDLKIGFLSMRWAVFYSYKNTCLDFLLIKNYVLCVVRPTLNKLNKYCTLYVKTTVQTTK